MNKILCIISKYDFQVDRLLSYLNNEYEHKGLNLSLLCAEKHIDTVKEKYYKKSSATDIIEYKYLKEDYFKIKEDDKLLAKIKSLNIDKAIIPITLNNIQIRFLPNGYMKEIGPLYNIIRLLRLCSLKRILLYDAGSLIKIELPNILDEYVDIHKGKRAFVIGNGPSLNKIDMTKLEDEITLGSNRCYLGFEKWGFAFKYWGISDRLQIEEHLSEWEENIPEETIKFFPFEYLPIFNLQNSCPVNFHYDYEGFPKKAKFDNDPVNLYLGFTVTHMLLQIAVIMGCNPVYLIGVDHNYKLNIKKQSYLTKTITLVKDGLQNFLSKLNIINQNVFDKQQKNITTYLKDNIWTSSDANEPTHFDKQYNDPIDGRSFVVPRSEESEMAFKEARAWCEKNNISIHNATPKSKLRVFEKVEYESLF